MADFDCPVCGARQGLSISHHCALPADSSSDEIALQLVQCAVCRFVAAAVYEESRRGALEAESWHHTGYTVDGDDWQALRRLMEACPDPGNPACQCPTHLVLARPAAGGRWRLTGLARWHDTFEMVRAP